MGVTPIVEEKRGRQRGIQRESNIKGGEERTRWRVRSTKKGEASTDHPIDQGKGLVDAKIG